MLLGFSLILGGSRLLDRLGMVTEQPAGNVTALVLLFIFECIRCLLGAAGHAYYFLEDVYPRMTGRRPLKTPGFVKAMFPGEEAIPAPSFAAANVRPAPPADAAGALLVSPARLCPHIC